MQVCFYKVDRPHSSRGSARWESEGAQDGVATHPSAHTATHRAAHLQLL